MAHATQDGYLAKVIMAFGAITLMLAAWSVLWNTEGHKIAQTLVSPTSATSVLGESTTATPYAVKVNHVQTSIDQASAAKRVTVSLRLENTSNTILQIAPGMQMYLVTDAGTAYNMTTQYLPPGQVIGGPLAPANTENLAIDFLIPASQAAERFILQLDASTTPTVIPIGD